MEQTIIWMLKKKYLEVLSHQKDFEEFYKQQEKEIMLVQGIQEPLACWCL